MIYYFQVKSTPPPFSKRSSAPVGDMTSNDDRYQRAVFYTHVADLKVSTREKMCFAIFSETTQKKFLKLTYIGKNGCRKRSH